MQLISTLVQRAQLALLAALIWLPSAAWAGTYATVKSLSAPDARGRWVSVDTTAAAGRIRAEERTALKVGLGLEVGDQVKTDQARVQLVLKTGETLTISEGADLTLGDRSVLQRLGEIYYQVRDVFKVDYGTVQTAVEGTEFTISGTDGPVRVAVTEGVVRVTSAGKSVRVKRGQVVTVAQSAVPGAPVALKGAGMRQALSKAWTMRRPKLQIGLLAGGGIVGEDLQIETRGFVALPVLPGMNLVAETGFGGLMGGAGSRVPVNLGLEMSLGGFSVGGSGQATLEDRTLECGGRKVSVHVGGAAHARFHLPLGRRLFVVGGARVGLSGDAIESSGLAGVGVNL